MILRDCLVRHGIVHSRKVLSLRPAAQLFFRNVLHVCDGAGRFEADPDLLRAVLYGPILHKIQRGDVVRWLTECHQAGLIKLYTVGGQGYGCVLNYGQRDRLRKVRYPSPEPDQLELATVAGESVEQGDRRRRARRKRPPDPPPEQNRIEEKKREGEGARAQAHASAPSMPPHPPILNREAKEVRGETQVEWLARLAAQYPGIDIERELCAAIEVQRRKGRQLERGWFEAHWLPHVDVPVEDPRELRRRQAEEERRRRQAEEERRRRQQNGSSGPAFAEILARLEQQRATNKKEDEQQ
ncbi:MAG: hypothetical protein D6781_04380 [Verrucomicrobia bacterium]|nr:MAG: hypothetical protein D6781_04380 [Verrucomicrobiota bacterium]